MEPRRGGSGDTVEYSDCQRDARGREKEMFLADARWCSSISYHGPPSCRKATAAPLASERKGEREREEGGGRSSSRTRCEVPRFRRKIVLGTGETGEERRGRRGEEQKRAGSRCSRNPLGIPKREMRSAKGRQGGRERLPELLRASARKWERMARSASLLRLKDEIRIEEGGRKRKQRGGERRRGRVLMEWINTLPSRVYLANAALWEELSWKARSRCVPRKNKEREREREREREGEGERERKAIRMESNQWRRIIARAITLRA